PSIPLVLIISQSFPIGMLAARFDVEACQTIGIVYGFDRLFCTPTRFVDVPHVVPALFGTTSMLALGEDGSVGELTDDCLVRACMLWIEGANSQNPSRSIFPRLLPHYLHIMIG